MPRSLPVPFAAPAPHYPNPSVHEQHDRPLYPIYPHYYPHHGPPAGSNCQFLFDVHTTNDDDDGGSGVTHDLESKPAADQGRRHEEDEIHEHYNEHPDPPNDALQAKDDAPHNFDMRHPLLPPPPPHDVHPYYHPYPPPFPLHPAPPPPCHPPLYAPPPYHPPRDPSRPRPPPDPTHRKLRKNAQSRARARRLRAELDLLRRRPDKTPRELGLLREHEERRQRKNVRTRRRAAEAKARMEGILAKPEEERSEEEREVLRVGMERRLRKNEGDRLRRVKLKEMGLTVKPAGMEIRGHEDRVGGREWGGQGWSGGSLGYPITSAGMMMSAGELEGDHFGDLERHDLDNLMTEEVSELLMQDDDDDDENADMGKVMDH